MLSKLLMKKLVYLKKNNKPILITIDIVKNILDLFLYLSINLAKR